MTIGEFLLCRDEGLTTHGWPRRRVGDLAITLGLPEADNWYPFGLTPRRGVRRLLPNHWLSLRDWSTVRHWPTDEVPGHRLSSAEVAATVAAVARRHLGAVCSAFRVHFPLTGGRDSRMLLECARAHTPRLSAFTMRLQHRFGEADAEMAPRVARLAGLEHRLLPYRQATAEQKAEWLERTGHCVAGRTLEACAMTLPLESAADTFHVGGVAGEAGRAVHWWPQDGPDTRLTAQDLLQRLRVPEIPPFLAGAEEWLAELKGFDACSILDLAHVEVRLGGWGGPLTQGELADRPIRLMWPLAHRQTFGAWLRLAPEARRASDWVEETIRQEWPELLRLPFNRLSALGHLRFHLRNGRRILSRNSA